MEELLKEKERLAERIKFYENQQATATKMISIYRSNARKIQSAIDAMSAPADVETDDLQVDHEAGK
jgi:hypothetical protein